METRPHGPQPAIENQEEQTQVWNGAPSGISYPQTARTVTVNRPSNPGNERSWGNQEIESSYWESYIVATPDELYDEAIALKNAGDLENAVAKWKAILEIAPDHVLSHAALGVHLQKLGRFDEAISHALKVTELEPRDSFSFTQLSVIYQRCGKIPEAEDAMARAREIQMGGAH